ncbi:acyl-CoA dehydrogenase family protein [Tepidiforma sp.]|uniref:acyl-CoA dehydrogenase family protein n=1 Tax=Tepidiforma sp. TaxID=2682230 RepID=UPI0021DC1C66|nr:acyl-CoA dehydrogenase family protein [Tepidiforma sp.]MCX7618560.1 acyl-CoA dehydrogenase family protein [Tepidiforma sp.]GIW18270.1 MAG: acyl-CoA dehydrogenase [Tepidiforma sp.]
MDFRLSPETEAWRQELRAFLKAELPPDFEGDDDFFDAEAAIPFARAFMRKLGARRWLAPAWPERYGGMGATAIEQFILNEELAYHRAPAGGRLFTIGIVGPTLLVHGTEEQKAEFLPKMASGEEWYCQGFSEPESGSDLASLQTRAVREGDDYVINGQKVWASNAHAADRMLLLARTDPERPKHKGISAFLVDMRSPGITVQGIDNMAYRHDFNRVFFEDVRVPAKNLLGGEHNGWYVATTTLDFERSNIAAISGARRTVHDLVRWAKERHPGGRPWDRPAVRAKLADLVVKAEVGRLVAFRTAWLQAKGEVPNYEASIGKIWMAMLGVEVANAGLGLLGAYGALKPGSPWAQLRGRVATSYLLAVAGPVGGGTAEIQRNIIAQRGLGLPRG